jgi:hypothetical protein
LSARGGWPFAIVADFGKSCAHSLERIFPRLRVVLPYAYNKNPEGSAYSKR